MPSSAGAAQPRALRDAACKKIHVAVRDRHQAVPPVVLGVALGLATADCGAELTALHEVRFPIGVVYQPLAFGGIAAAQQWSPPVSAETGLCETNPKSVKSLLTSDSRLLPIPMRGSHGDATHLRHLPVAPALLSQSPHQFPPPLR